VRRRAIPQEEKGEARGTLACIKNEKRSAMHQQKRAIKQKESATERGPRARLFPMFDGDTGGGETEVSLGEKVQFPEDIRQKGTLN